MERAITQRYAQSSRCLFLLDYDGTLANFKADPDDARLTQEQYDTLKTLCRNPRNTVVIISGRDRHTLNVWLSDLPINLAAEYGHFIKEQGRPWRVRSGHNPAWKRTVRPVLRKLVATVPGSFIEEKEFSLVWHYWGISEETAETAVQSVKLQLDTIASKFKLTIEPATKDLEVAAVKIDKSKIAGHWLDNQEWDFVLAAGDDTADEVLFKAMPEDVFTIKIGAGRSAARYRLPNPQALSELLQEINAID